MSLSNNKIIAHVKETTEKLASDKGRKAWPTFLFHATYVTNAVDIVIHDSLRCRNKAEDFHDVANQGALHAFTGSHNNARLYFRPKNGFHIRTEGIKTRGDPYRDMRQMSIPVSFNFKSIRIFQMHNVSFTRGNVQRSHEFLMGDAEFDTLEFDYIYHDSVLPGDLREHVMDCRMAEVAVPDEIRLPDNLHSIVFRTKWDMETFRFLLARAGVECLYPCAVEQVHGSVFMHWGMYIHDITFIEGMLILKLHMPLKYAPMDGVYKVDIRQIRKGEVIARYDRLIQLGGAGLRVKGFVDTADCVWEVYLEDVLAFNGRLERLQSAIFA